MFSHRDHPANPNARVSSLPTTAVLYLGAEVFIAAVIGFLLAILALVHRMLPRPPRDLKNDTVVVTGAGSGLGKAVAEEFSKAGCIVACVDQNLNSHLETVTNLSSQYQRIEELEPKNDFYQVSTQRRIFNYKCNLASRGEILGVAKKIHRDVGHVDVLITCTGDSSRNILDVISTNLMSHYWTMLAFIPSMIQCKHSHIVTIIPGSSTDDTYMGLKAAVADRRSRILQEIAAFWEANIQAALAEYKTVEYDRQITEFSQLSSASNQVHKYIIICLGIIEAIGQQFSNCNQLTFTTVAPKIEPRLLQQSEQQTARDIVEAVRRDQRTLTTSWAFYVFYPVCCTVYEAISSFTEWLYRPGCNDLT